MASSNGTLPTFVLPLWVVIDASEHEEKGLPYSLVVVDHTNKKGKVLPVFQNVELAQVFIKGRKIPGRDALGLASVGEVLQVAQWIGKEVKYVTFYWGPKKHRTYLTKDIISHFAKLYKD